MMPERNTDTLLRPLTARSIIVSLLLRSRPPRMRGARLVQWCRLFDVAEGTTRVALSRMVERGELVAEEGVYALAGRTQGRRVAQDWSLDPQRLPWTGAWRTAIVTVGARTASERSALRDAMRHLRHAELRDGVWVRPDNLPRRSAADEWWAVADQQCEWWTATPHDDPTDLFEAASWAGRADQLTRRLDSDTEVLDESGLASGFVTGAAALAHIRSDPLLPADLAATVPGDELRAAYRKYEVTFSEVIKGWFRSH
jgi:phenylacetic acid degradation operon negative regulatory protein